MKKIKTLSGPNGSGKTAAARQICSAMEIGQTVEKDACQDEMKNTKDVGCTDGIKGIIVKNIPDSAAFVHLFEVFQPLLSDDSDLAHIVFTCANVNLSLLPEHIKSQMEIIRTGYENDKQLIHCDWERIKGETSNLEVLAKYLNGAINICKSLPFPTPFKNEELPSMIFDTKNYVKSKQIDNQEVTINNLILNKEKLMEMVELPENFDKLEKIITLVKTQIQNIMISRRLAEPYDVLRLYIFNPDNSVSLKARIYQIVKEENEVYVSSAEAKKAYFFAKEYVGLLKKYKIDPYQHESVVSSHIKPDNKGEYIVNWSSIKSRETNALGFPAFSKN